MGSKVCHGREFVRSFDIAMENARITGTDDP